MKIFIIGLVLLLSSTVFAEVVPDPELKKLTSALEEAASQSQLNMASANIRKYWDAKLLQIEKKLESKLDKPKQKEFSESKKIWNTYRTSEVNFRASFFKGGSMQQLIANSAYSQITEHRIKELEALLTDSFD